MSGAIVSSRRARRGRQEREEVVLHPRPENSCILSAATSTAIARRVGSALTQLVECGGEGRLRRRRRSGRPSRAARSLRTTGGLRHGCARPCASGMRPPRASRPGTDPVFMLNAMRLRARSTSSTRTVSFWPTFTTSLGSLTNCSASCETWTRPSLCTPMSTNAPNAVTFVTTPSSTMPGLRSSIACTSSRKLGGANSARGSRPGFASSATMSRSVGSPTSSATYFDRIDLVDELLVADQRSAARRRGPLAICSTSGSARGARRRRRADASPPGMRRKPAACSNALGPRPETSSSCARRGTRRACRGGRRSSSRATCRCRRRAEQQRARGVELDADWLTQLSTTSPSFLREQRLVDVVLVLADADRLGLDLARARRADPAAAARSRSRRGSSGRARGTPRARGRTPSTRTRPPPTRPAVVSAELGWRRGELGHELSVSRDAVPLPIATSVTRWRRGRAGASAASEPSLRCVGTCG